MKIITIVVLFFVATQAEPPAANRYLPPQGSRSGFGTPSQIYGAPESGFNGQETSAVFRSRSSLPYGTPNNQGPSSRHPSTQYGPPGTQYNGPQSYDIPRFQMNGQGIPSLTYLPSQKYSTSTFGSVGNGFKQGQSSTYEGAQNRQYLPPGRGYTGDDGSNGVPANYNFEYSILDAASGNDFGHRESRQGDGTQGRYYVLLPDGRKQTVEYEADEDGYKPRISYQDTGLGDKGYGRNQNSGPPSQGPY